MTDASVHPAAPAPDRALYQPGRLERSGESIYYEWVTHGPDDRRPIVVFVHGAGGSHAVWYNQVLALSDEYRVLTWDSRGFGNSSCNAGTVSVDAAVGDLAALLETLGITGPVHLVGQSMGGWWAVGFALTHRDRVESLTLSDTPGGIWTDELRRHFAENRKRSVGGPARISRHFALGDTTHSARPDLVFLYQQLGSFHEPPMAQVLKMLGASGFDATDVVALQCRMLVIAGEEDAIFPAPMLRGLADRLGAAYGELPEAGHSPYFETPAAYNELLRGFLSER